MKKVFLDCGGNKGQSINLFKRSEEYSEDFLIYSFEPFVKLSNRHRHSDVVYSKKAVWIYDGEIDFYLDKNMSKPQGSTIIKSKRGRTLNKREPVKVPCFDFSRWIMSNFKKTDYIILKIDIEGAEYQVFDKMLNDGSIEYINRAYVEFHWNKIKMKKQEHVDLVNRLRNISSFKLLPEYSIYLKG